MDEPPKHLERPFLSVENGGTNLNIMSYNTLAQSLIRRDRYPTNGNIIRWNVRKTVLAQELTSYDCDVLALQEIDRDFQNFWSSLLESKGMDCLFHSQINRKHGLCIAWKKSLYRLGEVKTIDYDNVECNVPLQIPTGNIGLLVNLIPVSDAVAKPMVFGNTHLYWHPDAGYERARQMYIYMSQSLEFAAQGAENRRIVLAGDFNSTPFSPAYFLATGRSLDERALQILKDSAQTHYFGPIQAPSPFHLQNASPIPSNPDPRQVSQLVDIETALTEMHEAYANLGAAGHSAYSQYEKVHAANINCFGEPRYTNWTDDFRDTLDYIFALSPCDPRSKTESVLPCPIFVRKLLRIPDVAELGSEPNSLPRAGLCPSDHFAIMAGIAWRDMY